MPSPLGALRSAARFLDRTLDPWYTACVAIPAATLGGTIMVLAIIYSGLPPASAAVTRPARATAAVATVSKTICARAGHKNRSADADGREYLIEDDRFGSLDKEQCLRVTPHGRPAFRVTVSKARAAGDEPVQAYPYIQYGCYWGWCTPGSVLPLQISRIGSATSSWATTQRAAGDWNAGFDLWLEQGRPLAGGHANAAEVMIWLNATAPHYTVGGPAGTKKVKVAGRWFYLTHWHTGTGNVDQPAGWKYVQYRLVHPAWHVKNLKIAAVLADAGRRGLISRSWYLQGILAGNEIWKGGQGLATTWFSAAVTPKHAPKPVRPRLPKCPRHHRYCPARRHASLAA
jgi:hypothetical protein